MAAVPELQGLQIAHKPVTGSVADQVTFSMRGLPLLASGATMGSLGNTGHLWAHSKVYSSGGENALHKHDTEEHLFLVLQGEATFYFGDGSTRVARPFEGVILPKGTLYRFLANETSVNLVMIRVGSALIERPDDIDPKYNVPRELLDGRRDKSNKVADGESKVNGAHSQKVEVLPGQFFFFLLLLGDPRSSPRRHRWTWP